MYVRTYVQNSSIHTVKCKKCACFSAEKWGEKIFHTQHAKWLSTLVTSMSPPPRPQFSKILKNTQVLLITLDFRKISIQYEYHQNQYLSTKILEYPNTWTDYWSLHMQLKEFTRAESHMDCNFSCWQIFLTSLLEFIASFKMWTLLICEKEKTLIESAS